MQKKNESKGNDSILWKKLQNLTFSLKNGIM